VKIARKILLSLIFVLFLCAFCFAGQYSFAVFGDPQGRYSITKDLIAAINNDKSIGFVIITGDLTANGRLSEYDEYQKLKKTCNVPIYEVIGNHDFNLMGHGREMMKKWYGNRYYFMDLDNIRFVMMDNSNSRGLGSDQWQWLDKVLDTKSTILVFMHKPVIDATGYHPDHVMGPEKERSKLNRLLIEKHVRYIFSGHIHGYGRMEENGVIYVVAAGGGANLYLPAFAGGYYNYVKVTVDGDNISDEVVPLYND
jgi:3',5'-cyclic AMP phosphodiesterase CpdA